MGVLTVASLAVLALVELDEALDDVLAGEAATELAATMLPTLKTMSAAVAMANTLTRHPIAFNFLDPPTIVGRENVRIAPISSFQAPFRQRLRNPRIVSPPSSVFPRRGSMDER